MAENNNGYVIQDQNGYVNPAHELKMSKQVQSHEQIILTQTNQHDLEVLDKKHKHELDCKDKDLGWLGFIFGGKELTALNISGFLIFLLLIIGSWLTYVVYNNNNDIDNVVKIWSIITPIVTLTLGYIFGNKTSKTKK
ncbi:hypothetical protein DBR39_18370 [Chryseobacterium sp. KBW03]|uniref:hypothetical protein n=1 Tax=Chryseobacterium sp. KBW03 TaxID=2153362 RepID=UPI000F5917E9|nr:hypothetical protein [Chryseobacterium sp. KBW03]RQO35442.1 hypothetical protein DBR39_18370 [Chryseobacterium sp. KBW03]